MAPLTVDEYEQLARERMDRAAYDYYAGAAGDEQTLADNRKAFDRLKLRPRVPRPASIRTDPRSTKPGLAALRPVQRRSWWRVEPKSCSRSLLVRGSPGTS